MFFTELQHRNYTVTCSLQESASPLSSCPSPPHLLFQSAQPKKGQTDLRCQIRTSLESASPLSSCPSSPHLLPQSAQPKKGLTDLCRQTGASQEAVPPSSSCPSSSHLLPHSAQPKKGRRSFQISCADRTSAPTHPNNPCLLTPTEPSSQHFSSYNDRSPESPTTMPALVNQTAQSGGTVLRDQCSRDPSAQQSGSVGLRHHTSQRGGHMEGGGSSTAG